MALPFVLAEDDQIGIASAIQLNYGAAVPCLRGLRTDFSRVLGSERLKWGISSVASLVALPVARTAVPIIKGRMSCAGPVAGYKAG